MYKPKKAVAAVCAAAILLSPTGALGASPADFSDFPNDWSTPAMNKALDNGLLGGVGDGLIAPQGVLTRAQMAAIINRAFASSAKASLAGYSDVSTEAWYYDDMAKAVQMGTFSGAGDGLLEPERPITREEAFSVLARAFALKNGKAAVLAEFSDGGEVSDWAKGTVAAMVGGGYVNGSDGKRLNPRASITRAEFAAVMSNLVAQYIDAEEIARGIHSSNNESAKDVIDGNVIVRGSGVTLSGLTIKGDIIIADQADKVTLDKVNVEGRIVVRGASERLTLNESKAESVVVNSPGNAAVLDAQNSDLGTATIQSDMTLAGGNLDKVIVEKARQISIGKDATIKDMVVKAKDVTIGGAGTVEKIAANANNITINTVGSKVTAGKDNTGVVAGGTAVAPGETVTVDTNSKPGTSTDGSSSATPGTTPGGSTGSTENTPGGTEQPVAATLVNADSTKLVDLGWCQYVTVQFADGHSLKDCTLSVDGTDVTKAFTPVSDDGSLVKWEITNLNPAQLTVTCGSDTQTVALSGNANPTAPSVKNNTAPEYIIAHGTLSYWDYYLTNYDDKGQVRVDPAKTTFNLGGKSTSDVPAFFSPAAERSDQGSGTVLVKFSQKTDADRAWFAAVPENTSGAVQLVAFNENKNTLNDNLGYTKNSDGSLSIAIGQTNFTENGRYYVRVKAEGHDTALVPIHVVNATAPVLQLDGSGSYTSGVNAHFKVLNMTYGVTNPAYAAELTRPDGTTTQLEMIRDWYQIGDSIVLYNDVNAENGRNNIPYNGTYTLTVHSNGFKDMSATFTVTGGENSAPTARASRAIRSVDVRSSATSVRPGGGAGGSEGGGIGISANLKFNADLLINATLLDQLGLANDAAKGIVNRWTNDMSGYDTVWTSDGTAYNWRDYITAVSTARSAGSYLSFVDYAEDAKWDTRGTPSSVKSVLEDNLLGDVQYNGSWVGQQTPDVTLVNESGEGISTLPVGKDIILKASDAAYFEKLGSLNINKWQMDLDDQYYTVKGDTLTISKNALGLQQPGDNSITLYADGYRAKTLSVRYERSSESNLSLSGPGDITRGSQVRMTVEGSQGDYLNNLTSVTVNKPSGKTTNVHARGVGSYDDDFYTISRNNVLTIVDNDGSIFDEDGRYTISLDAKHYNRLTTKPFIVSGEQKAAPKYESAVTTGDGNVVLTFSGDAAAWGSSIGSVSVNGKAYGAASDLSVLNKREYRWKINATGRYELTLQGKEFSKDENRVVVSAKGYEDAVFTLAKDVNQPGSSEAPAIAEAPAAPTPSFPENGTVLLTFADVDNTWQNKLSSIDINGTTYNAYTGYFGQPGANEYQWKDNGYGKNALYLNKSAFKTGENLVTLSAEGYKDLIVRVTIEQDSGTPTPPATGEQDAPVVSYGSGGGYSYLYFDKDGHNKSGTQAYMNAITSVTVNNTEFDKTPFWTPTGNKYAVSNSGTMYLSFTNATFSGKDTAVLIKAEGYKDLSLTINKGGELTINNEATEAPTMPEGPAVEKGNGSWFYTLKFANADNTAAYLSSESFTLTVNNVKYDKSDVNVLNNDEFYIDTSDNTLMLHDSSFTTNGNTTITIHVDGYQDRVLTIDKNGDIVK